MGWDFGLVERHPPHREKKIAKARLQKKVRITLQFQVQKAILGQHGPLPIRTSWGKGGKILGDTWSLGKIWKEITQRGMICGVRIQRRKIFWGTDSGRKYFLGNHTGSRNLRRTQPSVDNMDGIPSGFTLGGRQNYGGLQSSGYTNSGTPTQGKQYGRGLFVVKIGSWEIHKEKIGRYSPLNGRLSLTKRYVSTYVIAKARVREIIPKVIFP